MNNRPTHARRALFTSGLAAAIGKTLSARTGAAAPSDAAPPLTPSAPRPRAARACILLYMAGGPSQIDTFDPKPGRPTGGPFAAIPTVVDGVLLSEHLPRLAAQMKRIALVRSLTAKEGNHDRARHLMHTGHPPQGGVVHPSLGALISEAHRGRDGLPGHVAIGGPGGGSGFLPATHAAFPVKSATKPVRHLMPHRSVDGARFERRLALVRNLDARFEASRGGQLVADRRAVHEQAVALMRSPRATAFAVESEPASAKEAYGGTDFGLSCLMARRLVEAGVPFVEVTLNGWDTHEDNFERVRALCQTLDRAMSALLDDLHARGLLEETLVLWMGDFGRTPRINERGGRDHHPACSSVVLAGGGVRGGQVIGATDDAGGVIIERPITVPDLYQSIAFALALDPNRMRMAPSGRPLRTVDGGQVIAGLFESR